MRIAIFCHSILSDWNHGTAHFLRGVATELAQRGHRVHTYEAENAWSVENLVADHGRGPLREVLSHYPHLSPVVMPDGFDVEAVLDDADLVLVHEWNDPALVARIGRHRVHGGSYLLFFHDTHHRAVTAPDELAQFDLSAYDGVLAFGEVLRRIYEKRGWGRRAFTWHEAADVRHFRPTPSMPKTRDLVWIGNWGDGERAEELDEFLFHPIRDLGLRARVHGVRYPAPALAALRTAKVEFGGWLPNYAAPAALSAAEFTVHVPRRPYAKALRGIPTIRPFEALACGVPLVSAPWHDDEGLFTPGADYLVAKDGSEMRKHARALLSDHAMAAELSARGLETIRKRHTCAHRADQLLLLSAALGRSDAFVPPRPDAPRETRVTA
jgi:spore maturation protein CgeB